MCTHTFQRWGNPVMLFWLTLALAAIGCSKADIPVAPTTPQTTLHVTAINDEGQAVDSADVFFDGTRVGVTPYQNRVLSPGLHSIRVSENGYQIFTNQILVVQGQSYAIEALLERIPAGEGQLVVSANLDSVRITVTNSNDELVIETFEQLSTHILLPGRYRVSGQKAGCPHVTEEVEIVAGETRTIFLRLLAQQTQPTLQFSITEDTVTTGEAVNLSWQSDGVRVIIDQGVGERGPNGSEKIICSTPGKKVFTATAFSQDNLTTEVRDTVYVEVSLVAPPALQFEVVQDTVEIGEAFDLRWQSDGHHVVIDQGVGVRGPNGNDSIVATRVGQRVFTATAYNSDNLATAKKDTIYVAANPAIQPSLQFRVVQDTVVVGETFDLNWQSDGNHVVIDQGVGVRGPNGSEGLTATSTGERIFTATAYNIDNLTTEKSDTIYVAPKEAVRPLLEFNVDQDSVRLGEAVDLTWESDGHHVVIDQGVGLRGPDGSEKVVCSIPGIKVFRAIAFNEDDLTTEGLDTVYVIPEQPVAPTLSFQVVQDTVVLGEPIDLSWDSNGDHVIIDQGIGTRGPAGSERVVCPTPGTKVFSATAYSTANLTTVLKDTVYIVELAPEPPTLQFEVEQDTVEVGQSVNLSWQSNGLQVAIDQGVGNRGPFGRDEVVFANPGNKVFTAIAFGEQNLLTSRKDSVYIKEAPLPPEPVVMLATTRLVTVGTPATITWQSQNADFLVIDHISSPASEGSEQITFSTPGIRIITATAFNQSGWRTATDTIEVVQLVVTPPVDDILVLADVSIRADRGPQGMVERAAGLFQIQTAGKYKVMAEVWYNSGDTQRNESYYLEFESTTNSSILPKNPNAGLQRVVPDDPGDPHTVSRNSGVFGLKQGAHLINVYHYGVISDSYPEFLNGPLAGAESVKILGFRLIYLGN